MSVGDIDSTLPIGLMHLVDRKSEVIHQHGGVATAVEFDDFEEMSLDDFIKNGVPKLKEYPYEYFTVIKDSTREQMFRILGDNVAMYHIKNIQDVFFDAFVERLLSDQKVFITPNLKYPLIQWMVEDDGTKDITVEIPPKQFLMSVGGWSGRYPIYHPTLWLRLRLTAANVPVFNRIAAVKDHIDDLGTGEVCHLMFPNVYNGGDICWGSTQYTVPEGVTITESVAIELTYQRFFNSQFNYDLIDYQDRSHMRELYDRLPKIPEFENKLAIMGRRSDEAVYLMQMARCFSEVDNMKKFQLRKEKDAMDFLRKTEDADD